ncbi:MAG: tetratricopeptide repeat protein [Dehalococcoidia bacterium]|nr:tetratricopeptide repeat protein [Dehalococcoidia bacterium]
MNGRQAARLTQTIKDKCIDLDPDDSDALTYRGEAYVHLCQREKALVDFDKVLALNPSHIDAYANRTLVIQLSQMESETTWA